ncbi:uncharacterized protein LOC113673742, partial [Pocillopora damicornis]|uniref:uncharacterized protein LOC113673742 n=1 Tax=Pocillopora damicornis TaxID=46731 RepID=UPI000F54F338
MRNCVDTEKREEYLICTNFTSNEITSSPKSWHLLQGNLLNSAFLFLTSKVVFNFQIVFLISILLITLNGVQVNCITESYSLSVSANGATFTGDVEVDVDNQTEVFRVPQHNDVDAMEMMNDFREGLSVYRVPSARACYVSKLDSSLPEPGKMRINMEQVSMQPRLSRHVTTKKRAWRVEGFAKRSALSKKFLDFCGSFPIYTIEQTSMDFSVSSLRRGHGRFKRSGPNTTPFTFRNFAACSYQ